MKRPQPDIGDVLRSSFINNVSTVKKLKRLWGTTTVNGVEVLKHRQFYYPSSSRSAEFEKLFKFLGTYDSVTASDPKGIETAWIYLNKNNNVDLDTEYNDFVASNLNQLWWDDADGVMPPGLTLTTSVIIEAETTTRADGTIRSTPLLDTSWTKAQLIQEIEDNYETLWDTCLISQHGVGVINKGSITDPVTSIVTPDEDDLSQNDPWLEVIARYALRTNGIPCTIKDVEIGLGTEQGRHYNTYVVSLEIPYNFFNNQALFVESIVHDLGSTYSTKLHTRLSYPNGHWTKTAIKAMSSSDLEDGTTITRPYRLWEDESSETSALYDALWYNYGGVWYLRAEPLTNPRAYSLTFKQLSGYVLQLIDSGYKKKSVPWWKKLIAIIIFVVVFVYSGGTAGKGALAVAKAILAASLVLNLITLALALAGEDEWASAFAWASKTVEPLVQLAAIINLFNGLGDLADSAADKAGDITKDSVAAALEASADAMVDNIIQGATDVLSGQITDASIAFTSKLVQLSMVPTKLKIESLNERNKDLKAEYDGMMKEMNQEYDVLRGFTKIYAKPATADWSLYASTFDQPYERGGGPLALGNIQRTTKQALRKADYKDPVFENILVI